jgi:hypothetical protein
MNRTALLKVVNLLAAALLLGAATVTAQTPTPSPTPDSEEIRRLREEKTRAELKRDIVTAEKAEFDAKFPKPTSSPLAGETKVNDGAVIENEMVSYVSMAYAANRIVEKLKAHNDSLVPNEKRLLSIDSLAIYNKADVDLLLNYKALNNQLEILHLEFCKVLQRGTPGCQTDAQGNFRTKSVFRGIPLVSSFLGSFVDLTALLRTNVTVQGHTFDIAEASLVSEVFRAMRAADGYGNAVELYYPAVFPPNLSADSSSELLERLEDLNDLKARVSVQTRALEDKLKATVELKQKVDELKTFIKTAPAQIKAADDELSRLERLRREVEGKGWRVPFDVLERIEKLRETIVKIQAKQVKAPGDLSAAVAGLAALGSNDPENPENDKLEAQLRETLAKLKSVGERFDQFVANLIKTDAATGINTLTAYIRAEQLRRVLQGKDSYWLQLSVVKAGGNNRIKTNLLVDIFTGGSRLSHSGGVIVQYNLYDPDGRSIVSDTLTEYTGYTKAGRIKRLINPAEVKDVPARTPAHP